MANYNAGAIQGTMTLDRRPFIEGLRLAQQQIRDFESGRATATVDADTRPAMVELDRVDAKADEVGRKRPTITVDANTKSAQQGLSGLMATAVSLGPVLIPAAAVLTGLVGGLAVPLAAAASGLGALAIVGVPAIKQVTTASAALAKAQAAYTNATTNKTRAAALLQERQVLMALSPVQRAAVSNLDALKASFHGLQQALAPQIFGVFNDGISVARAALPALRPLILAVTPALHLLAVELAGALKSPAFASFVNFLSGQAGPAITTFGHVVGNLAVGFAGLLKAFAPLVPGIESGMTGLTKKFADFGTAAGAGKSSGFQSFMTYVQTNGPLLVQALENLGKAAGNLVVGLGPFGHLELSGLVTLTNLVAKIPPSVLGPIATGIVAIVAAQKAWQIASVALTAAQWLLNIALDANPIGLVVLAIGLLVAGLVLAWQHSQTFRIVAVDAFSFVTRTFLALVGSIIDGAARAFGWVPGIGPKLKAAAAKFDTFRDNVNGALAGIRDRTVTVTAKGIIEANGKVYAAQASKNRASNPVDKAMGTGKATGGFVSGPGTATSDSIPARLSNGEYVVRAAAVRNVGVGYLDHLNRGYAQGGLVTSGSGSTAGMAQGVANFNKSTDDILAPLAQAALRQAAAAAAAAAGAAVHGGAVGGGAAQWKGLVDQVLSMLGQSTSLDAGVLRRINFESGGNPNAINNYDSNAKAGHPSQGLMQTIPSTFAVYAGPYRSLGILNPLANIYAGLNYALHRYGSIAAIDPINRPRGYDAGGTIPPGATLSVNRTGRSETALTWAQGNAVTRAAERLDTESAASRGALISGLTINTQANVSAKQIVEEAFWHAQVAARTGSHV